ncbi:hypothetical protein Lfu02_02980 [Longispora fulva]|uniref:Peptidase C51 domain-containing protein n=1 Tax=Longispora fulva TaxID=619741 RepID=A0A8J7GD37_9ACTN|nr:CHAP domain-containing protein [Longispora fulva]MBG6135830.1 hypothetical protein [Longispora fulva]GIG55926.1 hypothetical protein Lfu02_02980 [Longispora fulva]
MILAASAGLTTLGAAPAHADTRSAIVDTAASQLGSGPCNPGYYTSCGENWCADFAMWVWDHNGVNVIGLSPAAANFKSYGVANGTWHPYGDGYVPRVGDAVSFDDRTRIYHVAIVTEVRSITDITYIGGNQGSDDKMTSRVTQNRATPGTGDVIGYTSPAGVVDAQSGRVFHNLRYPEGNWSGASVADNNTHIAAVAEAGTTTNDLHLLTLINGTVYHNIRYAADGHWSGAGLADGNGHITGIAAAASGDGNLHLLTLVNGTVYHNIRHPNGQWTGAGLADGNGHITAIAAAGMANGNMHLVTLVNGSVYHNIRYADGSWSGAGLADGNGHITGIAAAGTGSDDLHLYTLAGGSVYHNERYAGAGHPYWTNAGIVDSNGRITAIAAAGTNTDRTHLLTLIGGSVYHNIRYEEGNWSGVNVEDANGGILAVAAGGTANGSLHVATLAP